MPLQEHHYTFAEEISRLESEREDLAEQVADLDAGNPLIEQLSQRGTEIDSHLEGLEWARSEWDVDGVTLAGLTGGEFGHVEDELVADTKKQGGSGPGNGATRIYFVAKGTVDAPYYDSEANFSTQIGAVSQLPIQFLKWAESRINDLTSVSEGNSTSFAALVAEKSRAKSTDK